MSNLGIAIAASGLDAQQAGMDAVAQNLANANTPGYVAETAVLSTNPSTNLDGVGDGVNVAAIAQVPDQLAQVANQQAQGSLSSATALQQVLTTVQDAFPEPNSSEGISSQLANFWSSWDSIEQNPSSPAPYTQVVNLASGLATSLNQASTTITQAASDANSQLNDLVSTDNPLLQQVAQLNSEIVEVQASGASPNSLIDEQNQLMGQLATDFGATSTTQSDGTMTVSIGGTTVVQGATAFQLAVSGSDASPPVGITVVDPSVTEVGGGTGSDTLSTVTPSGTAGGLLTALNTSLPEYQSGLNTVANDLALSVNQMLSYGYTTTGAAAQPLFTVGSTGTAASTADPVTAADITVNPAVVASPSTTLAVSNVQASSSGANPAANNGGNAQAIAEAGSATTGALTLTLADGTTVAINANGDIGDGNANADYAAFIQNLGSAVQSVNNQVTAETSVANAASQNLQEIAGVNTNQQMIDLINYQQAYQASAKVVSTVSDAFQSLLADL